jgi:hypothetical protein
MTRKKKSRLVVLLLLVAGVAFLVARALIDAPPPDDADLRVTYKPIPDEENAYTYFNSAAEALQFPDGFDARTQLADLLKPDGWDQALADKLVTANEGVFRILDQGLACPHCQLPEVTGYDALLPYLAPWRRIAMLGAVRAQWLLRGGRDEEAFEQAILIVRFGHRVQNGRGCLVAYLVGVAIEEIGLRQTRRMLADCTLDPNHLGAYVPRLAGYGVSARGLADALKVEYVCACSMLEDLLEGKGSGAPHDAKTFRKTRFLFLKPNKTKRAVAGTIRILIANASRTYAEATIPDFSRVNKPWWTIKAMASGNAVGKMLYGELMPALERASLMKCRTNVSVAATQVSIALRCYQLEHGELPDSLDALVPKYFDAVPLDDYDGEPIRYSKQKKVIYSVGDDLVDSGGADQTSHDPKEPTFKIAF